MGTFAQKQNQPQSAGLSEPVSSHTATPQPPLRADFILNLQRTIGNRAVGRMLRTPPEGLATGLTGTSSPRLGDDFHPSSMRSPEAVATSARPAVVERQARQKEEGLAEAAGAATVSQPVASAGAVVKMPLRDVVHPVAASLSRPDVRFRVPKVDALKAAYTDKDLKIPEAVIKGRVTKLLERMEKEKRLKSKDPVPTIIAKIFPAPGKIDEAEFNNAIDVADRTKIYESVIEADTKVKAVDKPKLQTAMKDAADLVKKVEGDAAGLTQVFGHQDAVAKGNYAKARTALAEVSKNMDTVVSTDYNLDDPEVGLGGWASFGSKKMHLLLRVAQVTNPSEAKATLIHEASHLSSSSVDDQVYYGNPGFFELDEAKKVANAAHYEELPRREMGTSKFDKKTFTPGVTAAGGAMTREDTVRAASDLHLRKAWDAGVDAHMLIRGVLRRHLLKDDAPFNANKALILEISKLMDLTIHEQSPAKMAVTTLDVTLSESVSRAVSLIKRLAPSVPFPLVGVLTDVELRDAIVARAVTNYGNLLKDATRDKALLDWLVAHYHKLPSV